MPDPNPDINVKFYAIDSNGNLDELNAEEDSLFADGRPVHFITHGLQGSSEEPTDWQQEMATTINRQLGAEGGNAIMVAWDAPLLNDLDPIQVAAELDSDLPTGDDLEFTRYEQAAADTEVVGQKILDFMNDSSIEGSYTTLIGHSLGAQVSGWVGEKSNQEGDAGVESTGGGGIGNIVGLDPARPSFETSVEEAGSLVPLAFGGAGVFPISGFGTGFRSSHKLGSDDATKVTVIHTSPYYGYRSPISTTSGENSDALDIYINGGNTFPVQEDLSGVRSHGYAIEFFQGLLNGEAYDQDSESEIRIFDDDQSSPDAGFRTIQPKSIDDLERPVDEIGNPLSIVSLNTVLNVGEGAADQTDRGIVNITRNRRDLSEVSDLQFTGENHAAGTKEGDFIEETSSFAADVWGLKGDDTLTATGGGDFLYGGEGDDDLSGPVSSSDDVYVGGKGNDTLGAFSDEEDNGNSVRLIGVNPWEENPGANEIDTLSGARRVEDVFVLGDSSSAYYQTGTVEFGVKVNDYALVDDFDASDTIEVQPNSSIILFDVDEKRGDLDFGEDLPAGIAIAYGSGFTSSDDIAGGGFDIAGIVDEVGDNAFSTGTEVTSGDFQAVEDAISGAGSIFIIN